jgi:hypothetical protein
VNVSTHHSTGHLLVSPSMFHVKQFGLTLRRTEAGSDMLIRRRLKIVLGGAENSFAGARILGNGDFLPH